MKQTWQQQKIADEEEGHFKRKLQEADISMSSKSMTNKTDTTDLNKHY